MAFAIASGLILLFLSTFVDTAYSDWLDRAGGRLAPIAASACLVIGLVTIDILTLILWVVLNVFYAAP